MISTLSEEGLETQWKDGQHWMEEFCEAGPDGMPHEMVAKAKQEEMERFARMKVYEVVPKHEVDHDNSVVIGSRWVNTNKGTPEKPVAKARALSFTARVAAACTSDFNQRTHTRRVVSGRITSVSSWSVWGSRSPKLCQAFTSQQESRS